MSKQDQKHPVDWNAMDEDDSDDSDESGSDKESVGSHEEQKYQDISHKPSYNDRDHHHHHHKREYDDNKYGDSRGYKQFKKPNPEGNFAQFYKNDPAFMAKVILKESAPHEILIRSEPLDVDSSLSVSEIKKILAEWGVDDCDVSFTNFGVKITIVITSSEEASKLYSELYRGAFNLFTRHKSRVMYQRDIDVLEKYADEAAAEYYENLKNSQVEEKEYEPRGKQLWML